MLDSDSDDSADEGSFDRTTRPSQKNPVPLRPGHRSSTVCATRYIESSMLGCYVRLIRAAESSA